MSTTSAAGSLLRRQLKEIQKSKDLPGISCGLVNDSNVLEWEVMLMINDDCKYYGGKALCLAPPLTLSSIRDTPLALPSFPFHVPPSSASPARVGELQG